MALEHAQIEYDKTIHVPRWAMALIAGLLLNLFGVLFSAGMLWAKVNSVEGRMDRLENVIIQKGIR